MNNKEFKKRLITFGKKLLQISAGTIFVGFALVLHIGAFAESIGSSFESKYHWIVFAVLALLFSIAELMRDKELMRDEPTILLIFCFFAVIGYICLGVGNAMYWFIGKLDEVIGMPVLAINIGALVLSIILLLVVLGLFKTIKSAVSKARWLFEPLKKSKK